jgi:hypothetical protein
MDNSSETDQISQFVNKNICLKNDQTTITNSVTTTTPYYVTISPITQCSSVQAGDNECSTNIAYLQTDQGTNTSFLLSKVDNMYKLSAVSASTANILSQILNYNEKSSKLCFDSTAAIPDVTNFIIEPKDGKYVLKFRKGHTDPSSSSTIYQYYYVGSCSNPSSICTLAAPKNKRLCLFKEADRAMQFDITISNVN